MAAPRSGGGDLIRFGGLLIDCVDATARGGPVDFCQACAHQGRCVAFHGTGDGRCVGKLHLESCNWRTWRAGETFAWRRERRAAGLLHRQTR